MRLKFSLPTGTIAVGLIFSLVFTNPDLISARQSPAKGLKRVKEIEHFVVRYNKGEFSAWPANNGIWSWRGGREILVGITHGKYVEQEGHKIANPRNSFARTSDGGRTWSPFSIDKIADQDITPKELTKRVNFRRRNFALRVRGIGYHGNNIETPCFYYSYDRGITWNGPFLFKGLENTEQLEGMIMTPRTDYNVQGRNECQIFFSATSGPWMDKTFVLSTNDGGLNFTFESWIVPPSDPYRAVMSQTIPLDYGKLVSFIRRRDMPPRSTPCWIDAYGSVDGGKSWYFLSRVAETGEGNSNGNPPAAIRLKDGRIFVVYANRSLKKMLCRVSEDNGKTWGEEMIIRDDLYFDGKGFADFGYPRVVQREDEKIVAIYYFADTERPEQHIVCSVFSPDNL